MRSSRNTQTISGSPREVVPSAMRAGVGNARGNIQLPVETIAVATGAGCRRAGIYVPSRSLQPEGLTRAQHSLPFPSFRGMTSHSPLRALTLASLAAISLAACATRPPASDVPLPASAFTPDSTRTEELAPGVRYSRIQILSGPWTVHMIEVSPNACGVDFHTVKGKDQIIGRELPSSVARRTASAEGRPVLAAVNADFFSFEPPGVPEGPQVSAGQVVKGEGAHREAVEGYALRKQPVFGVTVDGQVFLTDAHLDGWLRVDDGSSEPLRRVNPPAADEAVTLYNSYMGARTPTDTGVVEVVVRTIRGAALPGDSALGVVVRIDTAPAGVAIPSDGVVFARRVQLGTSSRPTVQQDDTVHWSLSFRGAPPRVKELVGGFPMLLRNGSPVLSEIAPMVRGFADKGHGRTVVAIRPDGTVLLVAVDGRQPDSRGMTLRELTVFMQSLGAIDALNLDGGGSTTLAFGDSVVSRPSDKDGERPVANALLLLGPKPGTCE